MGNARRRNKGLSQKEFSNKCRDFRKLEVWQSSRELVKTVYDLTSKLPDTEKFGLTSQINRCSISVPENISEGCAKSSNKDFIRYLKISLGSLYELETHIIICVDLKFIGKTKSNLIINDIQVLQKRIAALIKSNQQL